MTDILQSTRDNARKETFKYDGVKITVRESLGSDRMIGPVFRSYIREKLLEIHNAKLPAKKHVETIHDSIFQIILNFVLFATRTVEIKGKMPEGFQLPGMYGDEDEWYDAFCLFLKLPCALTDAWDDALVAVNKIEPDPEALPGGESSTTNT